jgi:glycine betaine/proline transport system substrate-binding protein
MQTNRFIKYNQSKREEIFMNLKPNSMKKGLALMLCVLLIAAFTGCAAQTSTTEPEESTNDRVITIADGQWASISFGAALMQFIIENGYGYKTEIKSADEAAMQADAEAGKIDIVPEWWMYDQDSHNKAKAAGLIMDVRDAFTATDGLWVPSYVVNGDTEKGIEAVAPDLKTMEDLKKYVDVFSDPNDPAKGVIQLGVDGWTANPDMIARMKKYDLASVYNYTTLKAEADLAANVVAKIEKGEPIVFYDYMPAGLLGKYEFIHIQDPVWEANPPSTVYVTSSVDLSKTAPDVYTFLARFLLDLPTRNAELAVIEEEGLTYPDAAKKFLKDNPDLWKNWVTDEAAEQISAALAE